MWSGVKSVISIYYMLPLRHTLKYINILVQLNGYTCTKEWEGKEEKRICLLVCLFVFNEKMSVEWTGRWHKSSTRK